jgi:hypothetical protein
MESANGTALAYSAATAAKSWFAAAMGQKASLSEPKASLSATLKGETFKAVLCLVAGLSRENSSVHG